MAIPKEQASRAAAELRRLADMIDLNSANGFAGVYVFIPPGEMENPHSLLLLDAAGTPAVFWSLIQTRVQVALLEAQEAERQSGPFHGRRS